eukprot:scaffold150857_cov24-Attheya_sp.AAC.1
MLQPYMSARQPRHNCALPLPQHSRRPLTWLPQQPNEPAKATITCNNNNNKINNNIHRRPKPNMACTTAFMIWQNLDCSTHPPPHNHRWVVSRPEPTWKLMSWEMAAAAKAVFVAVMAMLHNMIIIEEAIIPHCTKEMWRVVVMMQANYSKTNIETIRRIVRRVVVVGVVEVWRR